jgi:hypothetical protein
MGIIRMQFNPKRHFLIAKKLDVHQCICALEAIPASTPATAAALLAGLLLVAATPVQVENKRGS